MRVFIYWNIRKKCWSVRDCKTRKVIHHLEFLALSDCTFKVSEAGRQRVIREQRKNVHFGVEGTLIDMFTPLVKLGRQVRYNPYKQSTFTSDDKPVSSANLCMFFEDREVRAVGLQ